MRTIWKYPAAIGDDITIIVPAPADLLHIEAEPLTGAGLIFWFHVDTDRPMVRKEFQVFGTGHPLPDDISMVDHLATVLGGPFVWHVFAGVGGE